MKKTIFLLVLIAFLINSCSTDSEPKQEPDVIAPDIEFSIAGISESTPGVPIVVSNQIEIKVDAKDQGGISKIEAFINDEKVGEDTTAPYSIIVDISSYTSKVGSTNKYKDYTLKVIATDNAGNSSSTEQQISIDNEIPSISEVSLQENTVINGDTNAVTFAASDNEEITSVMVYLNNDLLITIDDANYELNIDTSALTDGENVLKIDAIDPAENIGTHIVKFIADNTGPAITIESLIENQIIAELTSLAPEVSDTYSTVTSFEILLGETSLALFDESVTSYQFEFDATQFPTGTNTLVFVAKDDLENESRKEIPIEIYRRLITINFPFNYFNPQLARIFVFASSIDGKVLDVERVFQDTQQIILRTQIDIAPDLEFSLTIGEYQSGDFGNHSNFTTLQNLKSSTLGVLNLKTAPRFEYGPRNPYSFPINGFDPDDVFNSTAYGFGYSGSINFNEQKFNLDRRKNTTSDINTDVVYFWLKNETLNDYSYAILDWDLPDDFTFNQSLMTKDGVEKRFHQTTLGSGDYVTTMNTIGYLVKMILKIMFSIL